MPMASAGAGSTAGCAASAIGIAAHRSWGLAHRSVAQRIVAPSAPTAGDRRRQLGTAFVTSHHNDRRHGHFRRWLQGLNLGAAVPHQARHAGIGSATRTAPSRCGRARRRSVVARRLPVPAQGRPRACPHRAVPRVRRPPPPATGWSGWSALPEALTPSWARSNLCYGPNSTTTGHGGGAGTMTRARTRHHQRRLRT